MQGRVLKYRNAHGGEHKGITRMGCVIRPQNGTCGVWESPLVNILAAMGRTNPRQRQMENNSPRLYLSILQPGVAKVGKGKGKPSVPARVEVSWASRFCRKNGLVRRLTWRTQQKQPRSGRCNKKGCTTTKAHRDVCHTSKRQGSPPCSNASRNTVD